MRARRRMGLMWPAVAPPGRSPTGCSATCWPCCAAGDADERPADPRTRAVRGGIATPAHLPGCIKGRPKVHGRDTQARRRSPRIARAIRRGDCPGPKASTAAEKRSQFGIGHPARVARAPTAATPGAHHHSAFCPGVNTHSECRLGLSRARASSGSYGRSPPGQDPDDAMFAPCLLGCRGTARY
jgi:hypothetical protein